MATILRQFNVLTEFANFLTMKFILFLLLLAFNSSLLAQTINPALAQEDSLKNILKLKESISSELNTQQQALITAAPSQIPDIEQKINDLKERLDYYDDSFILIASGSDPSRFRIQKKKEKLDLSQELRDLIQPLIGGLNKLTEEPRKLHDLDTEIQRLRLENSDIIALLGNLQRSKHNYLDAKIISEIEEKVKIWQQTLFSNKSALKVAEQKLQQKLASRKGFSESIEEIFRVFFKSRARNLVTALILSLVFWFAIRKGYRMFAKQIMLISARSPMSARFISLLFLIVSSFGTLVVFFVCLFKFSDWLLLIVGGLIVLGVFWASRQAIPLFWQQATLLLNIGAVREGERVIFNGLPMRVKNLRMYTTLTNPELNSGEVVLPLADIIPLRSRRFSLSEVWFPTKIGSWVILSDGTYGKVIEQNLEHVVIELLGGSTKFYQTSSLMELNPEVLDQGFRIGIDFGIDYENQKDATEEIPQKLLVDLQAALTKNKLIDDVKNYKVEFKAANSSSLDFYVAVDFEGRLASRYHELKRLLQKFMVESCNRNNWTIPFQQIDLHLRNPPAKAI